jgi:RNA polymerase sigma-70 factor (ECF subfamily)
VAARQELERLKRLIVSLPAQCRRVFELRKIDGQSQRDVAAEMGISERTVEKHLAKAVTRILQGVAGEEGREANEEVRKAGENGIRTQQD